MIESVRTWAGMLIVAGVLSVPAQGGAPVHLQPRARLGEVPVHVGFRPVNVDASTFFAGCPTILVERETRVHGTAVVEGDCAIHVSNRRNLSLREVDLTVGRLTITGGFDVDVNIGNDNCPQNQVCPGSSVGATSVTVDLDGRDSRVRVFFSSIAADRVDLLADGRDSMVRVHGSTLDAPGGITLRALGEDAELRVDVENRSIDDSILIGDTVTIETLGEDAETRVEDTELTANQVTIRSTGETRVEDSAFGAAAAAVSGDDRCEVRDSSPSTVSCD